MDRPENTPTSDILETGQVIYKNLQVYTYTYMHVTTNDGKRGHEFGREPRGTCGRVGKEAGGRENDVIILSQKIKK